MRGFGNRGHTVKSPNIGIEPPPTPIPEKWKILGHPLLWIRQWKKYSVRICIHLIVNILLSIPVNLFTVNKLLFAHGRTFSKLSLQLTRLYFIHFHCILYRQTWAKKIITLPKKCLSLAKVDMQYLSMELIITHSYLAYVR